MNASEYQDSSKRHVAHLCFVNNEKDNINPVHSLCAQSWTVKDPAVMGNLTPQAWSSLESPSLTARPRNSPVNNLSQDQFKNFAFPLDITAHSSGPPEARVPRELYHQSGGLQLCCYRLLAPWCRAQADGGAAVWSVDQDTLHLLSIKHLITCIVRQDALIVPAVFRPRWHLQKVCTFILCVQGWSCRVGGR